MKIRTSEYADLVARQSKSSPLLRDCLRAFWTGGAVCTAAQLLNDLYTALGMEREAAGRLVTVTLVFLSALLTGLGIFDRFAKYAGAGTLVPITGFANAVASPALDNKAEGFVTGVGAKLFTVAGPVILYGTLASAVYGVILWGMTALFNIPI